LIYFSIMLAIKLQRIGKIHQPSYRLVVAEKRSKMAAPPVEDLGSYNPLSKAAALNKERVLHWIKMGAQPTVTVHNFLVGQGILSAPTIAVKMRKKIKTETVEAPKTAVPAAAPAEKPIETPPETSTA
jgi:small subunit ribosomal protein S16